MFRRCSQSMKTHGQASHMACGRGGLQSMPPLLPLLMAIEWRLLRYPRMRAASTTFWRLAWRARRLTTANEYRTGSACDGLKTLACLCFSNAKPLGNKLASLSFALCPSRSPAILLMYPHSSCVSACLHARLRVSKESQLHAPARSSLVLTAEAPR